MANVDIKQKIIASIGAFNVGHLSANALNLFETLGYNTERQAPFDKPTYATFKESFVIDQSKFHEEKALVKDWRYVDLLFQLSKEEVRRQISLFDTRKVDRTIIETYLFFAIALSKDQYSRTELSSITREVNHLFPMPVMILFKHGQFLTLAVINRRQHKRDESKDVLEKVTLIKDIRIENPHRAHVEILFDLSFDELQRKYGFSNFVELHNAWQKTLDTKELNKRFYTELSNWYFWAMDHVSFPDDVEKNKDIRNATSLIRLITRIIFVWFIKEKSLVPDALFEPRVMQNILNAFCKNRKSDAYYRAILQNLFFATLNQRMNERGFAKEGTFQENRDNYGVKNLFRYGGDFAVAEKEVLALFKDIPFLNGGLFDCLDKEDDHDKVVYGDGFSRNPKKQAAVPDFLFFGDEEDYDLNATYGTRNKRYRVKGLFNIFSAYKFTVAENTPVEEEIALDPELLGRVFENLLASYNPETQTTARKQTGSFYTPREIVNYMVDESLKAYLKQKLGTDAAIKTEDADTGLEILFSYTEKEHAFTDKETKTLIDAIDNCKILDPACGSGAFPMGVLHKLVYVLHKLDPQNAKWKERQISKARQIDDPTVREQSIAYIEAAFANNELDYGRKLYLIENCIYGVDIQPIAVQIAKLRFFISLVVDQKKDFSRKNLGILSLPNLETKFVAANTLIGLDKPQTGGQISLKNLDVEKLEDDLKALRHQYFNARTRREKLAGQKKDRDLRKKISGLLERDGWNKDSASQVAAFDPYDQNASSPFFDPEWMFGWREGFDVVIANPPYVRVDDIDIEHKEKYKKIFKTCKGKYDLYYLFFEKSTQIKSSNGIISFITPNKYCASTSGEILRSIILDKNNTVEILSTSRLNVFEDVANYPIITLIKSLDSSGKIFVREAISIDQLQDSTESNYHLKIDSIRELPTYIIPINVSQKKIEIASSLLKNNTFLGKYISFSEGLRIPAKLELQNKTKDTLKIVKQYQFEKWSEIKDGSFISKDDFSKILSKSSDRYNKIISKKILIAEDALEITATIDNDYHIPQGGIYFGSPNKEHLPQINALLCVINSTLLSKVYEVLFGGMHMGGGYLRYRTNFLENLPINERILINTQLIILAAYMLVLNKQNRYSIFFEGLIDAMVYEIYFPDEIKSAKAEVLKYLNDLPELKEDWSDEKKSRTIEKVYKDISNPNHPVSVSMSKMDTIEAIRIIEGTQK